MTLSFQFSEEQEVTRRIMRRFCEERIEPYAKRMFEEKMLVPEVHRAAVEQGILGALIPPEYDGQGLDFITFNVVMEEVSRADLSLIGALALGYNATCSLTLARYGSERLKEEVLPKIAKEGWMVAVHVTEPGCGTDFTAVKTTATKKDGKYVINGEKQFVSLVPEIMKYGGGFMVTLKTRPELGARGMSMIYVPKDSEGITVTRFETMGIDVGGYTLNNVEVPEYCLIGEEGKGYEVTYSSFLAARVMVTTTMIGAAMRCIEIGMEYIRSREAFGRPIGAFQGIQFELADDYAMLEAVRWMNYRAAWMVDRYIKGEVKLEDAFLAATQAKLLASKYLPRVVDHVMEWHGALGFTTDLNLHMAYRSVRMQGVAEGTLNAQRIFIAAYLLGRDFLPWRWKPRR